MDMRRHGMPHAGPRAWTAATSLLVALLLSERSSAPTTRESAAPPPAPADTALADAASRDPLGSLPSDVVFDVTILPGRGLLEEEISAGAVHSRRGRYILFPDGSLHAAVGREEWIGYAPLGMLRVRQPIGVLSRPAQSRVLSRETMADVWLLAQQCGFSNPAVAPYAGNPALLSPKPNEILTIITVGVGGELGTFLERRAIDPKSITTDGVPEDPTNAGRFVRALAQLAWASDELPSDAMVLPLRFDLGPDPYARFLPPRAEPLRTP